MNQRRVVRSEAAIKISKDITVAFWDMIDVERVDFRVTSIATCKVAECNWQNEKCNTDEAARRRFDRSACTMMTRLVVDYALLIHPTPTLTLLKGKVLRSDGYPKVSPQIPKACRHGESAVGKIHISMSFPVFLSFTRHGSTTTIDIYNTRGQYT